MESMKDNAGIVGVGFTLQGRVPSRSGISFHSNVTDCPLEALRIDMPVEVWYDDITPEFSLPRFRPTT